MRNLSAGTCLAAALAAAAVSLGSPRVEAGGFAQTNLVSDIAGLATITDGALVNPWGISHSSASPFWVSNQGTNTATLYAVTDETAVSKVTAVNPPTGNVAIPTSGSGPQGPTGQVNNTNTASFLVGNGGDGKFAHFIFANLNDTISAWDPGAGASAIIQAATQGAVYTGLAINGAQTQLYAADNSLGGIDVFDAGFHPLSLAAGAFVDPALPAGLVPFNVQDIAGDVYVLYAPAGQPNQIHAPLGAGAVAIFDEAGNFIQQLTAGGNLAAPWGIAIAPPGFRRFSNDVLIGNFSFDHSEINAFIPANGNFHGTLPISTGSASAGGLWSLGFGIGGSNGSPDVLYFTDGINGQADGLFGAITSH